MLDEDPFTYTGPRKSWSETFKWAQETKLPLLHSSLTLVQFTNNLALYGICKDPELEEMCAFISKHGEKGGFQGLNVLGFNVSKPDHAPWVRAAFTVIYDHLDTHLSPENKETLHFGVMFLEHFFCKVSRYRSLICSLEETFQKMSIRVQKEQDHWIMGANASDLSGQLFPIPLMITKEAIQKSIERTK
ncbi:hypothetical protein BKA93DRAFT_724630 [Sparassis latifolia]